MADNENLEDGATEGESKGLGGKKLYIIIAVAVLLAGGIGFGAYTFLKGSDPQDEGEVISDEITEDTDTAADDNDKPSDKSEKSDDKEVANEESSTKAIAESNSDLKKEIGFGETYKFEPFSLNLANLENHYIRVQISLEYSGGEKQKKNSKSEHHS